VALVDIPEHSPALRRVTAIKDAAKRASDLCDHLLGYSGKGKFLIEMLNLNELVEEMANLLEVSISKKVNLVFDFCSRAPVIEADAAQVRQIVMNLITNASDAIGDVQGTIRLRTGIVDADWAYLADAYIAEDMEERTYAFIEVTDTGCGMDEQTRANIFDPFFTTKTTGRGLGLAAVLGIIRAHGGTIKLDSELGRGTVFTVLFPCSETAEPSAPGSDADTVADWQGKGTVLVIDDEDIVCDITRAMLEKSGFAAETAMNGEEGVQKFREHPDGFQAVLLDLTMPDMSGHEVYRAIREINTDIPVILSTGYAETDALENFDQADLAAFIHKPYDRLALIGALQNALKDE
jgi:CheY-like chemotaxis protein